MGYQFKVVAPRGYFDGVHLHKAGTIIELESEDFDRLLALNFEPLDEVSKNALDKARRKYKERTGQEYKPPVELEVGNLDPNKPDDLKQITKGAKVVKAAPAIVPVPKGPVPVKPETSGK